MFYLNNLIKFGIAGWINLGKLQINGNLLLCANIVINYYKQMNNYKNI